LCLALGSCWIAERAIIYRPARDGGNVDPAGWGLPAQPEQIETPDGIRLAAWWIPQNDPNAPAMILFQGRRGLRHWYGWQTRSLYERGVSLMIFQYRGYAGSEGHPTEEGLIRDGTAVYDWVRTRVGDRPIILYGRSLGGAVAAQTALRRSAQGLVLESTFTSMPDVARAVTGVPGIGFVVVTQFDTLAAVERLDVPLMIVHGTEDNLVPFEMGQSLFEASASHRKAFHPVEGARHWNAYSMAGNRYDRWFDALLENVRLYVAAPELHARSVSGPTIPDQAKTTVPVRVN
jgi:hypothetical protein